MTHGGSLRIYACHENYEREIHKNVGVLLVEEINCKLQSLETYLSFQFRAERIIDKFKSFLIEQKLSGKIVAAYGAAAKGNTLLNYAGVNTDLISVVFDASESKQGQYMPGSHIPIKDPVHIKDLNPDCIIILPWNIQEEIKNKINSYFSEDKLVVSINDFK